MKIKHSAGVATCACWLTLKLKECFDILGHANYYLSFLYYYFPLFIVTIYNIPHDYSRLSHMLTTPIYLFILPLCTYKVSHMTYTPIERLLRVQGPQLSPRTMDGFCDRCLIFSSALGAVRMYAIIRVGISIRFPATRIPPKPFMPMIEDAWPHGAFSFQLPIDRGRLTLQQEFTCIVAIYNGIYLSIHDGVMR